MVCNLESRVLCVDVLQRQTHGLLLQTFLAIDHDPVGKCQSKGMQLLSGL